MKSGFPCTLPGDPSSIILGADLRTGFPKLWNVKAIWICQCVSLGGVEGVKDAGPKPRALIEVRQPPPPSQARSNRKLTVSIIL